MKLKVKTRLTFVTIELLYGHCCFFVALLVLTHRYLLRCLFCHFFSKLLYNTVTTRACQTIVISWFNKGININSNSISTFQISAEKPFKITFTFQQMQNFYWHSKSFWEHSWGRRFNCLELTNCKKAARGPQNNRVTYFLRPFSMTQNNYTFGSRWTLVFWVSGNSSGLTSGVPKF